MKLFIFQNNTQADLSLPRYGDKGNITLKKDSKFIGEEYYFTYVKPPLNLLKFIEEVKEPEVEKSKEVQNEKKDTDAKNEQKNKLKKEEKIEKKTKSNINKKKESKMKKEKIILEQPEKVELDKNENDENENLNEEILLVEQPAGEMQVINEEEKESK